MGGCDDALLIYGTPKSSTVYIVKSPVTYRPSDGFFSKKLWVFSKGKFKKNPFYKKNWK